MIDRDLRRGALDADLRAEIDRELEGRLARLRKGLRRRRSGRRGCRPSGNRRTRCGGASLLVCPCSPSQIARSDRRRRIVSSRRFSARGRLRRCDGAPSRPGRRRANGAVRRRKSSACSSMPSPRRNSRSRRAMVWRAPDRHPQPGAHGVGEDQDGALKLQVPETALRGDTGRRQHEALRVERRPG